jgi:hypothetical protein
MNFLKRGMLISLSTAMVAVLLLLLRASPAFAVHDIEFPCNGVSGTTCDVFQLDGASSTVANADTCVGTENGCPSEESPVWPADWDALIFPGNFGVASTFTSNPNVGTGVGAGTFTVPWSGGSGSFSGVFTSSLVSTGTSTILKQGSKNSADISTWVVAQQASPPKDAFLAASLATYIAPNGDELLYHATTRFSPNGSATEGIWLFQENVQPCSLTGPNAGKLCVGTTATLAQHKKGDTFLFITFGGNGFANIQVAVWTADGPAGSLGVSSIVVCPTTGDGACSVTNAASAITLGGPSGPQAPGTGLNVSGSGFAGFPNGSVPALQFQEGGVDMNKVFPTGVPCFSSVMFASVSSGSSPSTASLKSILFGGFDTCAISATKACGTGAINADNTVTFPISGAVSNIGGGQVSNLTLADTFNGSPQALGSLSCTCGTNCTITSGTDCTTVTLQPNGTVNYKANVTSANDGGPDFVTATMGSGGSTTSAQSNTAMCKPLFLSDAISATKSCTTTLVPQSNLLVVQVDPSGTVTNTSSNVSLSNINVYDCRGGSFAAPTTTTGSDGVTTCSTVDPTTCSPGTLTLVKTISSLAAGFSSPYDDKYDPSSPGSGSTGIFTDTVLAIGQCTSKFCVCPTVAATQNASCPLCPLQ